MTGRVRQKIESLAMRGFPVSGAIELTTRCNLGCRYCFVDPRQSELSTRQLFTALDRFADAGVMSLLLTGGEPFLREDILDILAYIVEKRFFQTVILSNGTLLRDDHINFLIEHTAHIGYLRFSFFSHLAPVHDAFTRQPGSFELALANADRLKRGGVEIVVIINLTEENIGALPATKSFFRCRGFQVAVGVSKVYTDDRIHRVCGQTTTFEFYKRYLSFVDEEGRQAMRSTFESACSRGDGGDLLCESLFGMIALLAGGDITPCLSFRNAPIGNITRDQRPLKEILSESPLIKRLRSLRRSDLEPCNSCRFVRYCILCPGMILSETGSFDKPLAQTCNHTKALYETIYPATI
ncbi:MAG: radical SAM protein [Chitinispirillaceae bacterium]|nr:radical SAM protein [Chitinispirillaceae bacterium]